MYLQRQYGIIRRKALRLLKDVVVSLWSVLRLFVVPIDVWFRVYIGVFREKIGEYTWRYSTDVKTSMMWLLQKKKKEKRRISERWMRNVEFIAISKNDNANLTNNYWWTKQKNSTAVYEMLILCLYWMVRYAYWWSRPSTHVQLSLEQLIKSDKLHKISKTCNLILSICAWQHWLVVAMWTGSKSVTLSCTNL